MNFYDVQLLISVMSLLWENVTATLLSVQTKSFKNVMIDYNTLYDHSHWTNFANSEFDCANKLVEKGGIMYCYNAGSRTCIISFEYFDNTDPVRNSGWNCKSPDNCEYNLLVYYIRIKLHISN